MKRKSVDMCSGPLLSKIIVFVIPLLLTNLLQQLYNLADMVIVGRFDSSMSLAAVGATHSLSNLVINILINISVGVSTVIAQAQGAGDKDCIDKTVHTSISVSIIGSIIIAIVGIVFCKPVLALMGTPQNIIDDSTLYMRIIFMGYPIASIFNFGSAILRAKGDTKRPLIILSISGFFNVILNGIFVIVFKMGVAGVAIATVMSQVLSAVLVCKWLLEEDYPFRLKFGEVKIHGAQLKRILSVGLPIAAQAATFSFANVIIQSSVNSFGEIAVAGAAAASNITNILYVFINAPSHAATIFTGQNFGAKKFKRISVVLYECLVISVILGVSVGGVFILFSRQLLNLFTTDEQVIRCGLEILILLSLTYSFCGMMDTLSGSLKGINKSFVSMVNSIVGLFGVRIMWIITYSAFNRKLWILYLSYPLSWVFVVIVHSIFFAYYLRKMKKHIV